MSYEPEQENPDTSADAEATADGSDISGEDLNAAIHGGGETEFVTETKQPMSKGTLIVGGLLVACGVAVYFMYVRSGPSAAVAAANSNADQTITQFLSNGSENAKAIQMLVQNTEQAVKQFRWQPPQILNLKINPFMREKPRPIEEDQTAEKEKQRLALVAKVNEAVNELRLQTIIHRDPKKATAMINNTLYRKGQKITVAEGKVTFTVEEIRPDAVTVSAPAGDTPLKFDLKMKQ